MAPAPIRPLAWELPYAAGAAQRNSKKTKKYIYIIFQRDLSHEIEGSVPALAQRVKDPALP